MKTRLTGKICFKQSWTGMVLWVQVELIFEDAPNICKRWRKATAEDISELEIHSMITEL